MLLRWLSAIALLPGTVLVVIPSIIAVYSSWRGQPLSLAGAAELPFWLGITLTVPGVALAIWSSSLFFRFGDGTAAPWDPPKRFVVRGPYRHVRNPMIVGVVLLLFAESLFFQSWMLAGWAGLFFVGNTVYFPLVEEPGLVQRFGDDYIEYRRHVPRWLPRLNPWPPPGVRPPNQAE